MHSITVRSQMSERAGSDSRDKQRRSARRLPRVMAALLLALAAAGVPMRVAAVDYNNTNPGATICGDGSHSVTVLRNFYVQNAGLTYARVELRWSPTCNTVWTRSINLTGNGSGYATARSLTSDEKITVYNCPKDACAIHTETETGDVLPSLNSAGWSHQFVLPANGSVGSPAAPQPPSLRGKVTIHTNGTAYSLDTALEPTWTWFANNFKNERNLRNDSAVMTCTNSPDRCVTRLSPVLYDLDPSLDATTGAADLKLDMENTILPGWSSLVSGSPSLFYCTTGCPNEDVLVKAVPHGDPLLAGAFSITRDDGGYTAGTPAHYLHQSMYFEIRAYDHGCTPGCTGATSDDRVLLGHEMGHTLGLGHCDLNGGASVMCAARSTLTNELSFDGNHYWLPRTMDIRAFNALY